MNSKQCIEYLATFLSIAKKYDGRKQKTFHIANVKFMDGYFISDFGENSVIHFRIKEIPNWRFGIWCDYLNDNPNKINKITYFMEHKDLIDKFKPYAVQFSCVETIDKSETDEYIKKNFFPFYFFRKYLEQIYYHPIISYNLSCNFNMLTYKSIIKPYIKNRIYHIKHNIKDNYDRNYTLVNKDYLSCLIVKHNLTQLKYKFLIKSVEIVDNNKNGIEMYPRWDFVIRYNLTDKEMNNAENKLIKCLVNSMFLSNGRKLINHNVTINHITKDNKRFSITITKEEFIANYNGKTKATKFSANDTDWV